MSYSKEIINVDEKQFKSNPTPRRRKKNPDDIARGSRPYIIDWKTNNISFIQTAQDLKMLGVDNNTFMLKLYDSSLQDVDPYDPDLGEELIMRIMMECMANPYYFLRECLRIPDQGGTSKPYLLHRANLATTFLFLMNIDHYLVIPRQKGKTVSTVSILLWAYLFGTSNSEFMFINKKLEDANNNLMSMKNLRDALPKYMQSKVMISDEGKIVKGRENVKSITNPVMKNRVVTKPSASSVASAEGIGRGNTQPIQYFDEVEFTPFILTIIQASGPAYKTASENARLNRAPYCRIFTSTPGDLDTRSGQDAQLLISKTCRWTEKMYDMSERELREYVKLNASESGIVYVEYNYRQLGEGESWLNEMSRILLYDQLKIKREVHLHRLHGSSLSPFSAEDIAAVVDMKQQPIEEKIIRAKYKLDIYEKIDPTKIYFAGVDCSMGIGKDNNAVTLVNPLTMKPVAEFKSPFIGPAEFRLFIMEMVEKIAPRTVLCIERNMGGYQLVDELTHTHIRHNIYYEKVSDIMKNIDIKMKDGFLQREAMERRYQGVNTTGKSRELMMTVLEGNMVEYKDRFVTENITSDITKLIRNKSGKIEHGPGFNDDSLMSYLIACYVLEYGKNLASFGFIKGVTDIERTKKEVEEEQFKLVMESLPEEQRNMFIKFRDHNDDLIAEEQEMERHRHAFGTIEKDMGIEPTYETHTSNISDNRGTISLDLFDEFND